MDELRYHSGQQQREMQWLEQGTLYNLNKDIMKTRDRAVATHGQRSTVSPSLGVDPAHLRIS